MPPPRVGAASPPSPLAGLAFTARFRTQLGKLGGSPWYPPTAPGDDLSEQREGAPDPSGQGWGWLGRAGEDRQGPSTRQRAALLNSLHLTIPPGAQAGAALSRPLPLFLPHYLQDHCLHAVEYFTLVSPSHPTPAPVATFHAPFSPAPPSPVSVTS